MTIADSEKDFGYFHRAASENLLAAAEASKRSDYQLAIRFLNSAERMSRESIVKSGCPVEEMLALDKAHSAERLRLLVESLRR